MMLRSQPNSFPIQQRPISIRELMQYQQNVAKNQQRILPPSLTGQGGQSNILQPQAIARQTLKMGMPITPPSHIQSQSNQSIGPQYSSNIINDRKSPRRHRIFGPNSLQRRNYVSPNQSNNQMRSAGSFGNPSVPQLIDNSQMQNKSQSNSFTQPINQNKSSSDMYQTVRSMKKAKDPNNNTVYQQVSYQSQPSGIMLRSKQLSGTQQPSQNYNNRNTSPSTSFKQTSSNYPGQLTKKQSSQYQSIKPNSLLISNVSNKAPNSSNPLQMLKRTSSPAPAVPVYQNQFHNVNRSNQQNVKIVPQNQFGNGQKNPNYQKPSPYLQTLLKDFNQFEARQNSNSNSGGMFILQPQSHGIPSNIQHPPQIQNALYQSFGQSSRPPTGINDQQYRQINQVLSQAQFSQQQRNIYQNPFDPINLAIAGTPFTSYNNQNQPKLYNDDFRPINQAISHEQYGYQNPNNKGHYNQQTQIQQQPLVSLSPFQQNQREQLRQIPKRVQRIEKKIQEHDKQLDKLSRRVMQVKNKDQATQKNLLGQLIEKQQELNQKQRQINYNLERMSKIQNQNNYNKQQILKYQLQLQRAKRVEQLSKQNERLYHAIIRKQAEPNTRPTKISQVFVPPPPQQVIVHQVPQRSVYQSQQLPPVYRQKVQPNPYVNSYNTRPLTVSQAKRFDEIWESDGGSTGAGNSGELLSPFSINPDYY